MERASFRILVVITGHGDVAVFYVAARLRGGVTEVEVAPGV